MIASSTVGMSWIEFTDGVSDSRRFLLGFFGALLLASLIAVAGSMEGMLLVLIIYAVASYTHPYGEILGYDREWWNRQTDGGSTESTEDSVHRSSSTDLAGYVVRFFGRSLIFIIGIVAIIGGLIAAYYGHECVSAYDTALGQAGRVLSESAQQEYYTCHGLRLGGIISTVVGFVISMKV